MSRAALGEGTEAEAAFLEAPAVHGAGAASHNPEVKPRGREEGHQEGREREASREGAGVRPCKHKGPSLACHTSQEGSADAEMGGSSRMKYADSPSLHMRSIKL